MVFELVVQQDRFGVLFRGRQGTARLMSAVLRVFRLRNGKGEGTTSLVAGSQSDVQ